MCEFRGVRLEAGVSKTEFETIVIDGYYVNCVSVTQVDSLIVNMLDGNGASDQEAFIELKPKVEQFPMNFSSSRRRFCYHYHIPGVTSGHSLQCLALWGPAVSAERFLSVLFAICIGLEETIEDKTVPLMDLNEDSFKLIKKKKDIKPSLEILREEVKRRNESNKQDGNKPKPNGWSAKKRTDWLKANPITGEADVAFLFKRAKEIKKVMANATQKKSSSYAAEQGNKWYGHLPYLRLIHCLLEDDIKEKWIHRNDPKSIQEIDATSEFARASPDKVKDRLSKMKAIISSIMENWERSGQGDGGRIDEDDVI
ncbi:hypothetical protein IV203_020993 [Nitzschia inconspicua]|uniref:Uncharacterized protein n=1 Tax=Nitzschia inconspicua TaxID=303405 RepID=A0A9K3PD19_9STRA|nr:hypothetical protein IV203_020993 [Nitzschia inconspicua]